MLGDSALPKIVHKVELSLKKNKILKSFRQLRPQVPNFNTSIVLLSAIQLLSTDQFIHNTMAVLYSKLFAAKQLRHFGLDGEAAVMQHH